jgi:hypothetical protein
MSMASQAGHQLSCRSLCIVIGMHALLPQQKSWLLIMLPKLCLLCGVSLMIACSNATCTWGVILCRVVLEGCEVDK